MSTDPNDTQGRSFSPRKKLQLATILLCSQCEKLYAILGPAPYNEDRAVCRVCQKITHDRNILVGERSTGTSKTLLRMAAGLLRLYKDTRSTRALSHVGRNCNHSDHSGTKGMD